MTSQTIASLALLMAGREAGKDHIETFLPMVAESISNQGKDVISIGDLQVTIRGRFGLDIPQYAIEAILKRARRRGYVTLEQRAYRPNWEALKTLGFAEERRRVLEAQERFNARFATYCSENYSVDLTPDEADEAIQALLEEDQLKVARAVTNGLDSTSGNSPDVGTVLPRSGEKPKNSRYLAASFIHHLQSSQSPDLQFLDSIIKGHMLANSIFLSDPGQATRRFENTFVFLDTPFLIEALGYAGSAAEAPCRELISLLTEVGAEMRCFRHTVYELRGILESIATRIRTQDLKGIYGQSYGQTVDYLMEQGYTASDIEVFISRIDLNLGKLKINVVEKPSYSSTHAHQVDEKALETTLAGVMRYKNDLAVQRDVDSISAVMRLRAGRQPHLIENCRAIFVTPNRSLVTQVQRYFQDEGLEGIYPCITDYSLTNLLWLKKPTAAPDLPIKRIVADSYAALQPSDHLWTKYMNALERLTADGELDQEQYLLARSHFAAKETLMEVTLGDDKVFTKGTEKEILRLIEKKMIGDKEEEIERLKEAATVKERQMRDSHSQELDAEKTRATEATQKAVQAEDREKQREARIRERSQKISRLLVRGATAFIVLCAVVVNAVWSPTTEASFWTKYAGYIVGIVLGIPLVIELCFDRDVVVIFREIELKLSSRIEKYLRRITG